MEASLNLFSYAAGNPVLIGDPLGLMGMDSSCGGFGDCGCSSKIAEALKKFNNFFKPGWKQKNQKCWEKLSGMKKFTPVAYQNSKGAIPTPLSCMIKMTEGMTLKCRQSEPWEAGKGIFGGPAGGLVKSTDVWLTDQVCAKDSQGIFQTIFHEALHLCGAPPDASGQSKVAYDVSSECVPWGP